MALDFVTYEDTDDQFGYASAQPTTPGLVPEEDDKETGGGFGHYAGDMAKGALNIVPYTINSVIDFGVEIAEWARNTVVDEDVDWEFDLLPTFETETMAGTMTERLGSFALGMLMMNYATGITALAGLNEAMQASRALRYSVAVGKGFVADMVFTPENEERFSDLIQGFTGEGKNAVIDYLAYEDSDADFVKRLKNGLEGIPLGMAFDAFAEGMKKVLKLRRSAAHVAKDMDPEAGDVLSFKGTDAVPDAAEKMAQNRMKQGLTEADLPPGAAENEELLSRTEALEALIEDSKLPTPKNTGKAVFEHWSKDMPEDQMRVWGETVVAVYKGDLEAFGRDAMTAVSPSGAHYIDVDDIDSTMKMFNLVASLQPKGSQKVSFAEMASWAKNEGTKLGLNFNRLAKMTDDAELLPYHVTLIRGAITGSAERLTKMADEITGAGAGVSDLLVTQFAEEMDLHLQRLPYWERVRSATGRALAAMKVPVGDNYKAFAKVTQEEAAAAAKAEKDSIAEAIKGMMTSKDSILKLARKVSKSRGNILEFQRAVRGLQGSKLLNVIKHARYVNMLSRGSTNIVNVLGNAAHVVWSSYIEAAMSSVVGRMRGSTDRQHLRSIGQTFVGHMQGVGDFFNTLNSELRHLGDGELWEGFKTALKNPDERLAILESLNVDSTTRLMAEGDHARALTADYVGWTEGVMKPAGKALDLYGNIGAAVSTDIMGASDALFKNASYRGTVAGMLSDIGFNDGMAAHELQAFKEGMLPRIEKLAKGGRLDRATTVREARMNKLAMTIHEQAIHKARVHTWQNDLSGLSGGVYRALQQHDTMAKLVSTFVIPFYKTGANLFGFFSQRTPLLWRLNEEMKLAMKQGGRAADEAIAKRAAGAMIYAGAMGIYMSGNLTGTHPKADRAALNAVGIPEHSVKINGTWVSYNRFDPFGYFLGMVADLGSAAQYMDQNQISDAVNHMVLAVGSNVAEKSYLRGVGDLYNLVTEPERGRDAFVRNHVRALMPLSGAVATLNDMTDPHLREARTFLDSVRKTLPFASKNNPVLTDGFGEEIKKESTVLQLMGLNSVSADRFSPGYLELAALAPWPTDGEGIYKGVRMTREEHNEYKQLMQQYAHPRKQLDQLVSSSAYINASDAVRTRMLSHVSRQIRDTGRGLLLRKDPAFRAKVLANAEKQRQEYLKNPSAVLTKSTPNVEQSVIRKRMFRLTR